MADDPLVFSADEDFTAERLNRAMQFVNLRLKATEAVRADFDVAVATLKDVGLARINDALLPAYQELVGLIQLGVLFTTTSASPVVLGAGARTFLIAEADRERFGAAAYLGAQKTGDATVRLSGALQSYDRASGLLVIAVDQVVGPAGATVAAWTISAAAPPDYATTAHAVGAYTQAEVDAAIATVSAAIAANTAALTAITAGDNPALDSFAEVLTRFLADEGNISSVMTALGNRLRTDTAQGLTAAAQAQARANLGSDGVYASKRNYFWDPGLLVSQENGQTAGNLSGNSTFYVADLMQVSSTGSQTVTAGLTGPASPATSGYRAQVRIGTANASPGANDLIFYSAAFEGLDVLDLFFGYSFASPMVVTFGVNSSIPGTFPVAIRNATTDRSWVGTFTIAQSEVNTDVVRTLSVPGDVIGAWNRSVGVGFYLSIAPLIGSTFVGVAGWQSGNKLSVAGCTNLAATAGAIFQVMDVGIFKGTIAPPVVSTPFDQCLRKAQRYFALVSAVTRFNAAAGNCYQETPIFFPAPLRVGPALTLKTAGARSNVSSSIAAYLDAQVARHSILSTGAGDTYSIGDVYAVNARM